MDELMVTRIINLTGWLVMTLLAILIAVMSSRYFLMSLELAAPPPASFAAGDHGPDCHLPIACRRWDHRTGSGCLEFSRVVPRALSESSPLARQDLRGECSRRWCRRSFSRYDRAGWTRRKVRIWDVGRAVDGDRGIRLSSHPSV